MTISARAMLVGRFYRLTRDPGTAYYMRCSEASLRALQKRVVGKDPLLLRPDDLKLQRALTLCREQEHVLAARLTRFIDDSGKRHETRAYVAFPPDYVLRDVSKPPGYKPKEKRAVAESDDDKEGDRDAEKEEDVRSEAS